jgi:hypothetical protein
MGVNWDGGLIRWMPHHDGRSNNYPLNHLHPFRLRVVMPADRGLPEIAVELHIGFSLHTFTRGCEPTDNRSDKYSDNRETRTFCPIRYELSKNLGAIARDLVERSCAFAKDDNYVTVVFGEVRYGVFFNLTRRKDLGKNAVLVVIQSAYALDAEKPEPGRGKISFRALLGHTLRGTKPRKP